jgi:hypothetical protein
MKRAKEGWESLKPGWTRVNFNYFISETEFRYIVDAVDLVARYGWAMLPLYEMDPRSGLWTHRASDTFMPVSLSSFSCDGQRFSWKTPSERVPESALVEQLETGRALLSAACQARPAALRAPELPQAFEDSRWFPLPHEVVSYLLSRQTSAGPAREHFSRAAFSPVQKAAYQPPSKESCPQD